MAKYVSSAKWGRAGDYKRVGSKYEGTDIIGKAYRERKAGRNTAPAKKKSSTSGAINRSGSGKSGGNAQLSAEAQALQDRQQSWLDSQGGIANTQGSVAGKMESRADLIGNRNIAAGEASSAIARSYDSAIGQQNRNLRRYGLNPNSGRFAHGQRVMANARAAADAGAQTKARRAADRDSLAAYGQTQNAYSQAAQTGFGVYDRYDRLTDDYAANEAYMEPNSGGGSTFGGGNTPPVGTVLPNGSIWVGKYGSNVTATGTIGGGKGASRGGWSGTNNIDRDNRLRGGLTNREKQANLDRRGGGAQQGRRDLGPSNQQTPLRPDTMNNQRLPYDYSSNYGLDWGLF